MRADSCGSIICAASAALNYYDGNIVLMIACLVLVMIFELEIAGRA